LRWVERRPGGEADVAGKRYNRRQVLIGGIGVAGGLGVATAVLLVDGEVAETGTRSKGSLHVVAHADDTILFMNPDEQGEIARGVPVRTVFLTAGNVNPATWYWESREAGVLAAFAQMAGVANAWSGSTLTVNGHALDLRTLSGNPNVSVVFMRLPDGGANGSGFPASDHESLQSLWTGTIPTMHAVDGSTSYAKRDLIITLASLMTRFQPVTIRTQDFVHTFGGGDHSDHYATALFTRAASIAYGSVEHALVGYMCYPTVFLTSNLSGEQLKDKIHTYFVYAPHDPAVPQTFAAAKANGSYGRWLSRRYTVPLSNRASLSRG
jgi:LmbE family N-acetylglucosaminyl deacetylase